MTYFLRFLLLAAFLCNLSLAIPAQAETASEKGMRIAQASRDRNRSHGDTSVSGEMILASPGGQTSTRRFDTQWVDLGNGKGSRSQMIFRWPGDIRGTTLLTHSHDQRADDQWLKLPALGKVRRITASGRSGSFVGSEFAYEDLVDQEVEKFDHVWIAEQPCPAGGQCHVLDRRPKTVSGYSHMRVWLDVKNLLPQKIDYFDRAGAHLKTLRTSGYRLYEGRYWRPSKMDMRNHLTGKSTVLTWSGYQFNLGLNANSFTVTALRRSN